MITSSFLTKRHRLVKTRTKNSLSLSTWLSKNITFNLFKIFPSVLASVCWFFEKRDTTSQTFQCQASLGLWRSLSFHSLVAVPKETSPDNPRPFHPSTLKNREEKPTSIPNFEYIWSVIYALRFHFILVRFASFWVLCFIYLCLWLLKQFIILMHTLAPATELTEYNRNMFI